MRRLRRERGAFRAMCAQTRNLASQTHELRGASDGRIECIQIDRLLEKIERALGAQCLEQHQPAGVGEPEVDEHQDHSLPG